MTEDTKLEVTVDKEEPDIPHLAIQMLAGNMWTDRHCQSPEDIARTFLPLTFMKREEMLAFIEDASLIYCLSDNWMSQGINGMPICTAVHKLTKEDHQKLVEEMERIQGKS